VDAGSRDSPAQAHCVDARDWLDILVVAWGSRGRRFESGQPDYKNAGQLGCPLIATAAVGATSTNTAVARSASTVIEPALTMRTPRRVR
jgi:hypothetical protein